MRLRRGFVGRGLRWLWIVGEGGKARVLSLEKVGWGGGGEGECREVVELAVERWGVWREVLEGELRVVVG